MWPCLSVETTRLRSAFFSRSKYESRPNSPAPPLYDYRGGDRCGAGLGACAATDAPRYFSHTWDPHDLRRATLWRHGPGPDGGLSHLLLRVSLPLHHRHRARRIEINPWRGHPTLSIP